MSQSFTHLSSQSTFTASKVRCHAESLIFSNSTFSQHATREITARPGERGIALGEFVTVFERSFWGYCRETEAKLAKSDDGFHPKARVEPTLLKSLAWPTNLVRSLDKFATFSVSVGSDIQRAYPIYSVCIVYISFAGLETRGTWQSWRFSECSVIQLLTVE